MKRKILIAIAVLVGLFLLIQLVPVNRTNPAVTREIKWDSPQTRALAQRACFDCHSNETVWPWYSYVAPVSILVGRHVEEGRGRLNFSAWDKPNSGLQEVERSINSGQMPIWDFLLMHPEAKFTAAEQAQLLAGLSASYKLDPPIARQGRD
jgi:hypothetical protein